MSEIEGALKQDEQAQEKVPETKGEITSLFGLTIDGIKKGVNATINFLGTNISEAKFGQNSLETKKIEIGEFISKFGGLDKKTKLYSNMLDLLDLGYLSISELRDYLIIYVKNQMLDLYNKICSEDKIKEKDYLINEKLTDSEKNLLVYCIRKEYITRNQLNILQEVFLKHGININDFVANYKEHHYVLILMIKLGLTHEQIKSNQYSIG